MTYASLPRFAAAIRSYRHDLQAPINIVGLGSSVGVGADCANPSVNAPLPYFVSRLRALFDPASLYNIVGYNHSVNGTVVSEGLTALFAAVAAGHTPTVVLLAYGMNDGEVPQFNSGQCFPSVYGSKPPDTSPVGVVNIIIEARKLGADVIVMTTPHHKCAGYTYGLDSGLPQNYPTYIPPNVGPEQIQPPASASNLTADFLGNGGSLTVSHRHLRVNQAMRAAAADMRAPLIDVERYWFKAMETYGEAALFNGTESGNKHPNDLGHAQSYHAGIDDFLIAVALGKQQPGSELNLGFVMGDMEIVGTVKTRSLNNMRRRTIEAGTETFYINDKDAKEEGGYFPNVANAQNIALPDYGAGEIIIYAFNGQAATKAEKYGWKTYGGSITLSSAIWTLGSGVFTVSTSGLNVVVTPTQANTYISWKYEQW